MKAQTQKAIDLLRVEAEKLAAGKKRKAGKLNDPKADIQELLHQLQVYQIELEMQIDELRKSQEELESERRRFKALYDLAPVGYFILDPNCVILDCNNTGTALLGLDRGKIRGKRFPQFVVKNDSEPFYLFIRKLITSKKKQIAQLKILSQDTFFHAQVEGTLVIDPETGAAQCYLAVIDVSQEIIAELKQREMKERLEMALDASSTGTWGIDIETGKVTLDSFSRTIFGLREIDFHGTYRSLMSLVHTDDRNRVDEHLMKAMRNEEKLQIEFRAKAEAEELLYVEARGHTMELHTGKRYFTGTLMNITAKKKLEEETMQMRMNQQKDLLKAVFDTQENERKRISIALHDSVGQLLYAMKINMDHDSALVDSNPTVKKTYGLLEQAIKETRNISFHLVPSILKDFGLQAAVNEMIKRISTPGLTVVAKFTGFDSKLDLNSKTFVFRILQELTNNIMKHSHASSASIELQRNKDKLRILAIDNGIGFNTDIAIENGTGICSIRNRLSLYNGTLDIVSGKGNGTKVTILLNGVR
jgi:PAS domain S-box-containing protein